MIRPVSIRYQGMRIEGTVESPIWARERCFGIVTCSGEAVVEIRLFDAAVKRPYGPSWHEIDLVR